MERKLRQLLQWWTNLTQDTNIKETNMVEKNKKRKKLYQAEYYIKNIDRLKQYKRNWYQETRKESNDNQRSN